MNTIHAAKVVRDAKRYNAIMLIAVARVALHYQQSVWHVAHHEHLKPKIVEQMVIEGLDPLPSVHWITTGYGAQVLDSIR